MNNYRITFSATNINVDYWNRHQKKQAEASCKFRDLPDIYRFHIHQILHKAKELNITDIWFFFEPYVEMTWLCDDENAANQLIDFAKDYCEKRNLVNFRVFTPKNGNFAEWFANSDTEKEFGAKRYSLCRQYVELDYIYSGYIYEEFGGKGKREQVKRTIHGLCNPLGLNYIDEAYICFSRGLICLLFRFFSFKRAVWIYTRIFRQKY